MITLITGGVKSGKSSFALRYILSKKYDKRAFIATGESFDEEMRLRIERHKAERGNLFDTFEEPIEVSSVIRKLDGEYDAILFECLTTYLGNLYYYSETRSIDVEEYVNNLLNTIREISSDIVIVTNEVGWSLVPENELGRLYVEMLGKLNSTIAHYSQEVYLTISGLEVRIK